LATTGICMLTPLSGISLAESPPDPKPSKKYFEPAALAYTARLHSERRFMTDNQASAMQDVLWTFWIVLGSYLEEKDLVAEFGDKYRAYQKTVPMLLPWRRPIGCPHLKGR